MTAVSYGTLELLGGRWVLSDVRPHVALKLKSMFPRISKTQTGVFSFPFSEESSADLDWFMQRYPMAMSDADRRKLKGGKELFERNRAESEAIMLPDWQPPKRAGLKPPWELYQPQAQAVELLHRKKRLLLGDDVGLGKTFVALGAVAGSPYLPAAIVVQTHLATQWVNKFIKPATYLSAHIIEGTRPYSLPPANVYIFKYSNIAGWVDVAATGLFKAVFFDEVHELRRGGEAEKGKAAKVFADNAIIRCGMSATPVFNYGDEAFEIVEFLEPGALGTREEFRREWCTKAGSDKWMVKDPEALGTYLREIQLLIRRLRQGRPINRIPVEVEYDEEVAEESAELARTLALKVLKGSFTEAGKAARDLDMFARHQTGVAKAKSVAAHVRMVLEAGTPVLLAGWHRECFARGTPVLMADGSVEPIERIDVGAKVMGVGGKARTVLSTVRGHGRRYRVTPNRGGSSWVCSENHILILRPSEGRDRSVLKMTAKQYAALPERKRRSLVLFRSNAIEFEDAGPVFEPWLMGYWLGDGASSLNSVRVATADREVVEELSTIASRHGLRLTSQPCKGGATHCRFYDIVSMRAGPWGRNKVLNAFKELGLKNNKHVPHSYKTASVGDRLELLAGLIDSDGHVYRGLSAGSADFVNTNQVLAEDVAFVARSLGIQATVKKTTSSSGFGNGELRTAFRVTISGDLTVLPTRIARKKPPARAGQKNVLHSGFKIEQAESGDYFGFEVDGDNLFLLSDFTVVHNCYDIWLRELKDFAPVMYTGTEDAKKKDRSKEAFMRGDTNLMIISLRSGAGLDGLQHRCSTVAIGELDWSPQIYEQLFGRVDRPGQKADEITALYYFTNSGSDPIVMSVNGVKRDQARGIMDPGLGVQAVYSDESRIKMLAEQYLARHG